MSAERGTMTAVLAGLLLVGWLGPARGAADAEAAAHESAAAVPQVSFEERVGSSVLRQYRLGCLSQLTYLLGSDGVGAVVDPQRDVQHYLDDAETLGLEIRFVILTHTHADFVAGHVELAERVGAEILVSAEAGAEFPHRAMRDGDTTALGSARLEFWATPGHTLDSMTILVRVPGATVEPAFALTGDTLFIGSVGRPDLVAGEATPALLARKAYDSVTRLKGLPDATKILPAHGAGSLCGAHLSSDTVSTMGAEKERNPYLRDLSRTEFVAELLSGLPFVPSYFAHAARLNQKGPPIVEGADELPPELAPEDLVTLAAQGAWIIDLRDRSEYAAAHIPGSVHVAVRGRLGTWVGTIVPHDRALVLVGSDEEVREASFRLKRIGFDDVTGYLKGGMDAWTSSGREVRMTRAYEPSELHAAMREKREPIIVDVRTPQEYAEARIRGSVNLPAAHPERFHQVLDRSRPLVLVCNSAYRSSMAVGLLERQGFEHVGNLVGGLDAWLEASLPLEGAEPLASRAPSAGLAAPQGLEIYLPEPIEPRALALALSTQPGRYAVLDIRPRWQFDEYHVPGAVSAEIDDLAPRVAALSPPTRIVIVDRDGVQAYAAAGALLTRLGPQGRTVRVLEGGTARFYLEVELGAARGGAAAGSVPSPAPPAASPPSGAPPERAPARKIRHAGC